MIQRHRPQVPLGRRASRRVPVGELSVGTAALSTADPRSAPPGRAPRYEAIGLCSSRMVRSGRSLDDLLDRVVSDSETLETLDGALARAQGDRGGPRVVIRAARDSIFSVRSRRGCRPGRRLEQSSSGGHSTGGLLARPALFARHCVERAATSGKLSQARARGSAIPPDADAITGWDAHAYLVRSARRWRSLGSRRRHPRISPLPPPGPPHITLRKFDWGIGSRSRAQLWKGGPDEIEPEGPQ